MWSTTTAIDGLYGSEIDRMLKTAGCSIPWNVVSPDTLPARSARGRHLFVCNSQDSHLPGEHWFVIYLDGNGLGECFDSFGADPGIYDDRYEAFLRDRCREWTYNTVPFQNLDSNVCGYYAVFYCLCKSNGHPIGDVLLTMFLAGDDGIKDSVINFIVNCTLKKK